MKKILVLLLGLLVFAGCASPEEKAEKKDLETLESIGFTAENAQSFYNFSNSTKIIYSEMININNKMENNSYVVTNEDYKKVATAVEVSKEAYSELNPKEKEEYFDYLNNEDRSSPLLILKNIEEEHRDFNVTDAAMMFDMLTYFSKNAIEAGGISDTKKEEAIKWYHQNNDYTNLFKEAYDYRTKNGTYLDY